MIGQYLQYPKIAKDFSNYLELYYKYQDDYQIDEILAGSIRENLCNKLKRAQFDEKLSVIGLLLSKLNSGFKQVVRDAEKLEILMMELKSCMMEVWTEIWRNVSSLCKRNLNRSGKRSGKPDF